MKYLSILLFSCIAWGQVPHLTPEQWTQMLFCDQSAKHPNDGRICRERPEDVNGRTDSICSRVPEWGSDYWHCMPEENAKKIWERPNIDMVPCYSGACSMLVEPRWHPPRNNVLYRRQRSLQSVASNTS